jgi:dipeptidyl aminopeptidase/acylaminoacyl peptidase
MLNDLHLNAYGNTPGTAFTWVAESAGQSPGVYLSPQPQPQTRTNLKPARMIDLNPKLRAYEPELPPTHHVALCIPKSFTWRHEVLDGLIPGCLTLPHGSPPFPTIVLIHGGPPATARPDRYALDPGLACKAVLTRTGYLVYEPDYLGSTGYGYSYRGELKGYRGSLDFQDIQLGTSALIQLGLADPQHIVAFGASHGGTLASLWGLKNNLLTAVVAVCGVADHHSRRGTTDATGLDAEYANGGGTPEPVTNLPRRLGGLPTVIEASEGEIGTVPQAIFYGPNDRRIPQEQAHRLAFALREAGITVQLVELSGADHRVANPYGTNVDRAHLRALMTMPLAFVQRQRTATSASQ